MRILIVDDEPGLRKSLSLLLDAEGYDVAAEGDAARALARSLAEPFDMILCDVRMPKLDGLQFLKRYREGAGTALIIMMSAFGGDDAAIDALKEGAYDYLPKPFRSEEVLLTLRKAEERERLRARVASLEAELASVTDKELVAESRAMRAVKELAARVAPHPTTVLITGESGVGKEVVARAIHRMSPRRDRRFVAVNCGAIPEALLESELFGHVRGAFTGAARDKTGLFEEADRSTLLLDEVGELPLSLQVKLLRVLQEGEIRRVGEEKVRRVDARVLAATARDLEADVSAGRFREDLYYRLNVVRIHIPPLRERAEDLDALISRTLEARSTPQRKLTLSSEARTLLRVHPWPGNVRELENALERAAVLSRSDQLAAEDFDLGQRTGGSAVPVGRHQGTSLRAAVAVAESAAIRAALEQADGNRREAARMLEISERSLFYKLKRMEGP